MPGVRGRGLIMQNAECRMHNFGSPADLDLYSFAEFKTISKRLVNRLRSFIIQNAWLCQ
jgi:hypothetical protein